MIRLCVSSHFVEQQAYKICEEIRNSTLYKVVRIVCSEGNDIADQWNGKDLITQVILEDKTGNLYSIKPDHTGLRFAQGEISYREYRKTQKQEGIKGYSSFFLLMGFSFVMMITLMRFLT